MSGANNERVSDKHTTKRSKNMGVLLGPSFWVSFGENIRLQRDIFSPKQEQSSLQRDIFYRASLLKIARGAKLHKSASSRQSLI
jgi:hypothetical protein